MSSRFFDAARRHRCGPDWVVGYLSSVLDEIDGRDDLPAELRTVLDRNLVSFSDSHLDRVGGS